eukprot:s127_g20.t9
MLAVPKCVIEMGVPESPLLTGVEAGVSVIFVAQASPLLADAIPCTPHINLFCTVSMTRNLSDEVVRPNSVL